MVSMRAIPHHFIFSVLYQFGKFDRPFFRTKSCYREILWHCAPFVFDIFYVPVDPVQPIWLSIAPYRWVPRRKRASERAAMLE